VKLQMVGYWPYKFDNIDPYFALSGIKNLCDQRIVSYLDSGFKLRGWLGYSFCRFHCGFPDSKMGTWDLTDGTWVWPEGFSHYFKYHNLDIPPLFLEHIEKNNFTINLTPEIEKILSIDKKKFERSPTDKSLIPHDNNYWLNWLESKKVMNVNFNRDNLVGANYNIKKEQYDWSKLPEDDSFLNGK